MPKTIREQTIFPVCVREARVIRSTDVSPGMRRITLAGGEFGAFAKDGFKHPEFRSEGFDDDIRLVFPHPGETEPVLPPQKDGTVEFHVTPRPLMRAYTVRRWDPATGELDIEFARHGVGVATNWAYECGPGDRVHVVGPAHSQAWPIGVDRFLVAGDETALPAISRLLEELPESLDADVFIEVSDAAHEQPMPERAGVRLTWLHRDGEPAGTTTRLLDAVRAMPWPDGVVYAWLAGEAVTLRPIRRLLVDERGLPKDHIEFTGYWRRPSDTVDDEDQTQQPQAPPVDSPIDSLFDQLHEMAEILPPFALRAVVTLGVADLMSRGIADVATLAARSGANPKALGKVLRYLAAIDVVVSVDGGQRYELSDLGQLLTDDFVVDALDLARPVGQMDLGFAGLLEATRTGDAAYELVTGTSFAERRTDADFESAFNDQIAKRAKYVAPAIAVSAGVRSVADGTAARIVVHSDAATVFGEAIARAWPGAEVALAGLPSQAAYLRQDLDASVTDPDVRRRMTVREQSLFEVSPGSDAVLFAGGFDRLRDEDAAHALRRAAESTGRAGRILVFSHPLDPSDVDEHAAEEDLRNLTVHGSGVRTDAEQRAVFATAGLDVASVETVGWGFTLYTLTSNG